MTGKPRTFRCPVPDCDALLKVPVDAKPGDYLCKCQAAVLRYHIKTTVISITGREEVNRWLQEVKP